MISQLGKAVLEQEHGRLKELERKLLKDIDERKQVLKDRQTALSEIRGQLADILKDIGQSHV